MEIVGRQQGEVFEFQAVGQVCMGVETYIISPMTEGSDEIHGELEALHCVWFKVVVGKR